LFWFSSSCSSFSGLSIFDYPLVFSNVYYVHDI
jgi:hypothetical protein